MTVDLNDEILQDFLVEAGEILEQLNEDLVELEQSSGDKEILNTVFRGFHTIKGGAGFLALTGLVDICHRAEDVFNVLRNGERAVDAELMDVVLAVIDVVNDMFAEVQNGELPTPADPELLQRLEVLAVPAGNDEPAKDQSDEDFENMLEASPAEPETAAQPSQDDALEAEFDSLLDDLYSQGKGPGQAANTSTNTADSSATDKPVEDPLEAEFGALLDDLHGTGGPGKKAVVENAQSNSPNSGDITEAEFDALLDQLHGDGKGPVPAVASEAIESAGSPVEKPVQQQVVAEKKKPVEKSSSENETTKAPNKTAKKETAAPKVESTVRVDTGRLDDIMNMVGELVLVRNRLTTLKDTLDNEPLDQAVANLDVVTADLQSAVMKTRMQPVKKVFGRFPRVVRDLARSLKKEINLEMRGEDTDLDKNLVEALADPLVHLVRNSVDHGIELPDERIAAGKSRDGTVVLSASQEGDHILMTIEDDGKGMDANILRQKAVEKGLMDEESAAGLSDKECYNLIFHAGFSTKDVISDVSGRGVGMDVVKTKIAQLNGSVEVDSTLGKGSCVIIRVPLTLAIMPTLMVTLGNQPFALPLGSVSEIFELEEQKTNLLDGQKVVMVRDQPLPIYFLQDWLSSHGGSVNQTTGHVVVVHIGSQTIGFVVETLIGQEEVVIKPLGAFLQGLPGFAGATITGDGRIALILDVPGLLKTHAGGF
ncbi:MAG: chemotaxis protein CheA [Gammaproteobacteria bacterium]